MNLKLKLELNNNRVSLYFMFFFSTIVKRCIHLIMSFSYIQNNIKFHYVEIKHYITI